MRRAATALAIAAAAAWPAAAPAQDDGPVEVAAAGNAFTGGLAFDPPEVSVPVGKAVRWRNTDAFVPHTATEDHGLWDLGGDYGATPANPSGFGPGETVERRFEAGTHRYYCRVHPEEMRATVAVPVTASARRERRRRGARRRARASWVVAARWAAEPPAEGLVFDVERRHAGGPWSALRTGTRSGSARLRTRRDPRAWELRARLRRADSAGAATDWSPPARPR